MKQILITGKGSYVGESFKRYLSGNKDYQIDTLDMENLNWIKFDFSKYDTVFHVAGLAHADVGRVSEERKKFYYDVNTDLAIRVASVAKAANVKQFIFMSSMIIYGESASIGKKKVITRETNPKPSNFYGDSKLQADIGIRKLESNTFKVVVLRPPMIYGKGSKGNYSLLAKFAKKTLIFPKIKNERSMLYIDNLCEFIHLMVKNEEHGIFFPQNGDYTNTVDMIKIIAETDGKRIWFTSIFNFLFYLLGYFPGKVGTIINKVFGNLVYDMSLSDYTENSYRVKTLEESIRETEV